MLDLASLAKDVKMWEDYMKNPAYKDILSVLAQHRFDQYKSYVEAGFTESQALIMIGKDIY